MAPTRGEFQLLLRSSASAHRAAHSNSYDDPYEPAIDSDEPVEPEALQTEANAEPAGEDPDARVPMGENAVNGGTEIIDPSAVAAKKKGPVVGLREKRIPDDKRSTTPYMTKYERARVLGTRALQIRYVGRETE